MNTMNINELCKKAHQNAVEHGFYDPEPRFGESIALMHTELSEALEEHRKGKPMIYHICYEPGNRYNAICNKDLNCGETETECPYRSGPEGIAVELADCVIRIFDYMGYVMERDPEIDFEAILREKMEYNRSRPYRHGGKTL